MSATPEAIWLEARKLEQQGRLQDAITAYRRLLALRPELADCWYNLGVLLRQTGQYEAALASYEQALACRVSQPEEVHLNRAVIYSDALHQHAAAERELAAALAANPTYAPALLNLANLQEDLGLRAAAEATYERLLDAHPANVEALARYAGVKTFVSADDPLIQRLERELSNTAASPAERASVAFALGRALDSCGAYDAAFEAYVQGNRLSRESVPPDISRYDRQVEEHRIEGIIAAFPAAAVAAPVPETLPATTPSSGDPRPVFICGMFRSGSTLIEQLLASQQSITAGGELDILPRLAAQLPVEHIEAAQLAARLSAAYLAELRRAFPDARWVTDKRPDNFLHIGLIKRMFPAAKIVHTTRDALDNCLSIFFLHLDQRMSYALDLMDIGHHYLQYQRLMRHWRTLYGSDIIDVHYDSYVRDPEGEADRLLAAIGVERNAAATPVNKTASAVKTASVWQVREAVYQRSSGRSRHYARQLGALQEYLRSGGTPTP